MPVAAVRTTLNRIHDGSDANRPQPMRGWSAAGLGLAGLCLALAGIGIASDVANGLQFGREPSLFEILAIALTATYGATGALITRHRPANPIGWIFLGIALDTGLTALGDTYAQRRLAMWQAVAWWQQWSFYLSYPVAFSLILMLFPHGRLPSARWRPLAVFAVVAEAPRLLLAAVVSSPVIGHMSGIVLLTENPAAVIPAGNEAPRLFPPKPVPTAGEHVCGASAARKDFLLSTHS